tara:strand:+ start:385 stop:1011 length:627 start_codon:yes stop_codon:yes gene_type:complete
MNRKPLLLIASILFLALLFIFLNNNFNQKSLMEQIDSQKLKKSVKYEDALDILNKMKKQKEIPDSRIDNAVITMRDNDYVTAEIKCDTLIKYNQEPTLLIGSIVATFYDSIGPLSVLRSDFAEYDQNQSLVAKKNITMYNLRVKDSLYFINQDIAQVVWDKTYSRLESSNEFILKDSTSRCTKGSEFQSNLDLSEIIILNSMGTSNCK